MLIGINVSHTSAMIFMKNIVPSDNSWVKALKSYCEIVPYVRNKPSQNTGVCHLRKKHSCLRKTFFH